MSGVVRFISDLHLGHKSMADRRGFLTVEKHDSTIIECWNSVVKKRDTTWILGDVTMEKSNYKILDQLNGFKKVVLGNHDKPQHVRSMLNHVNSVCGCFAYKKGVMLTHIPIHVRETNFNRSKINVHGHVHENTLESPNHINVCAEVLDYVPRDLDWLLKHM